MHGVAGRCATAAAHGSHGIVDPVLDTREEERDLGEDQRFRHRSLDKVRVEGVEVNARFLFGKLLLKTVVEVEDVTLGRSVDG